MATRPTVRARWATDDLSELREIEGNLLVLDNKVEPTEEWKDSGELYRENLPRAYLNYQLDLIDAWLWHLDERYAVGDFHLGASTETATTIGDRLGGTWTDHGTDTLAGQTVRVFEKTA